MGFTLSWPAWLLEVLGINDPSKELLLMTSAFRDTWCTTSARTFGCTTSARTLCAGSHFPGAWFLGAELQKIIAPAILSQGRAKEGSQAQTLFFSSQTSLKWKPSTKWSGFPFYCVYLLSPYILELLLFLANWKERRWMLTVLPSFHTPLFECLSSYIQTISLPQDSVWYPSSWVFLCRFIL